MAEYIAVCRTMTNKSRTAVFEFRGLTTSPEGYYESANVKHQQNMHTKSDHAEQYKAVQQ